MICILHGYLLDGSGSNLWTQAIIRTLCNAGETVHLMCQEPHPEKFEYVSRATKYDEELKPTTLLEREVPFEGGCIMHKPTLGDVLPVYVWDKYDEFENVVPMVELDDAAIADYIQRNERVLDHLVQEHGITALHANHAVLMSVVARIVGDRRGIPFTIMPHGSAIEYAVKPDRRLFDMASSAFDSAGRIFVIGPEIRQRVNAVFDGIPGINDKMVDLNLGVDTSLFEPIAPRRRPENIQSLNEALEGVPRGKGAALSRAMVDSLEDGMSLEALLAATKAASAYTAKNTDIDCEGSLAQVDWGKDKILLFVGRLIASKGIHGILAALPAILMKEPDTRLVVVGHGPLREPLEAMIWALENGHRDLLGRIIEGGRYLEGAAAPEPLVHLQHFLTRLEGRGQLDAYFEAARRCRLSERVIFTGYLTHRELRFLFPCCDVAIFPSIVAEAGPLVFLEAMASGVFPMGIYFAGMAASIDSVSDRVPGAVVELMKLRQDPEHTVMDIVDDAVGALSLGRAHAADLRRVAVERYDWKAVGQKLKDTLASLS